MTYILRPSAIVPALALPLALGIYAFGCAAGGSGGPGGGDGGDGTDSSFATGDGGGDLDSGGLDGGGSGDAGDLDGGGSGDGGGGLDGGSSGDGGGGLDGGGSSDGGPLDGGGLDPRFCDSVERCSDGIDNDCDGEVDEGCSCSPGEVSQCFRGDPRGRGIGVCLDGTMVCTGSVEFGTWGPCVGDTLESPELCDVAGLDEDCDGAENEGCECVEGDPPLFCGTDTGECSSALQHCVAGRWTACEGAIPPEAESCDGLDNDCDGVPDDDLRRACGSSVGACRPGIETCTDGVWGLCEGGNLPTTETCDGLDNDCNGEIDELVTRPCGSSLGRCIAGVETCTAGVFDACTGRVDPITETCNGVDDDCDGAIDEGLSRSCGLTDIGSCTLGVESCVDGAWGACAGSVGPEPERCDGVLDENCDGSVDEGCECIAGATEPCGSDIGACVPGMRTCGADGRWGACEGMTLPSSESCNGIDDDCDGITDEALSRACGSEIGACVAGTQTCSIGTWGGCIGEIGPGPETCDGSLDEDCDGEIDEGCECTIDATRPCGSDIGACSPGLDTCGLDGTWGGCVGAISPTRETCNGLDDDCDGSLDEGLSRACGSDTGECVAGVQTCSVGVWGGCAGEIGPAPEICDGLLDQDCDGTVDEGCGCTAGETRPCGSATGTCVQGAQTCAIDGTWGACTGEIGPGVEVCDGALDEDCDGIVDEGCACVSGQTRACGSTTGACDAGTETCDLSGSWGTCTGAVGPGVEVCNGIDDDCDGSTDEGLNRTCGATDLGVCQFGSQSCSAGSWGFCTGNVDPGLERCDGTLDENCNGTVDEGCACISGQTRACGNGVGECQQGLETCDLSGSWGACIGGSGPTPESCNGLDDDCDGSIDEALSRSCGSAAGACMPGLETCSAGAWGVCTGGVGPEPELCDGAIDEDCDGSIDEGCLCTAGQTQPCGTNMGECVAGLRTCDLMGAFGACVGEILPGVESCNGLDDDCDGAIDEGVCFPPNVTCPMDQTTDLGLSVTLGASGADPDGGALSYAWTIVTAPAGSSALPASPTSASTSFTPDVAGDTTLRFCATDDEGAQSCCTVLVRAMNTCSLPATPTLTACGISWDRRPLVEFDPLPAGVTYELFKDADALPYATVTLEGQNYHRPLAELGLGGPPPGVDTSIYLRACVSADPTCCATSLPVDISLVESCTTPIAPAPENTIFSEYAINGDGPCPGADCEAGEAIEIVNLSHCPVSLDNHHFSYCNGSCGAFRWMNFGPAEIIPPRGVYVAIRNHAASTCSYPFFGPDDPGLYGLKISTLAMESGGSLASGWFVNSTGSGLSKLRIASGPWVDIASGTTIDQIAPYLTSAGECSSIGFDAYDACGNIGATASPGTTLTPNQLGRLWHPCDAVTAPVPALCE